MSHLLATVERAGDNLLLVEEILARTAGDGEPVGSRRPAGRRRRALAAHRVEAPLAGTPLSSALPRSSNSSPEPATRSLTVLETSTSPGPADVGDPGADVDGDAADLPVEELALAGVEPGAELDAERLDGLPDRLRAADRARRPVEAREEAVARGVDLAAPVAGEQAADDALCSRISSRQAASPSSAAFAVDSTMSVNRTVASTRSGSVSSQARSCETSATSRRTSAISSSCCR